MTMGDDEDDVAEDLPPREFMDEEQAREDPTVDDEEGEQEPHADLPEGARAADYVKEREDGGEETPPAERGQRRG
jgi:hypothetical protein